MMIIEMISKIVIVAIFFVSHLNEIVYCGRSLEYINYCKLRIYTAFGLDINKRVQHRDTIPKIAFQFTRFDMLETEENGDLSAEQDFFLHMYGLLLANDTTKTLRQFCSDFFNDVDVTLREHFLDSENTTEILKHAFSDLTYHNFKMDVDYAAHMYFEHLLDRLECIDGDDFMTVAEFCQGKKKAEPRNINKSNDDDQQFTKLYKEDSVSMSPRNESLFLQNDTYFNPVSLLWMQTKCKELKLPIPQHPISKQYKKLKLLNEPVNRITIKGDGNCWFRSISMWISGTEDFHAEIRSALIKAYKEDEAIKKIVGRDVDEYIALTGMDELGTWATEIEIMATAIFLNTHIYVYSKYREDFVWNLFEKSGSYNYELKNNEQCLYIELVNENHFQVVQSV